MKGDNMEKLNEKDCLEFIQWILDQWEIDTKEVQDKALELIGAEG